MSDFLVGRIKAGDQEVLSEVYKTYREPFIQFALRYHRDTELLYDVYQDAIIALFEKTTQGNLELEKSSLKTYIFSIGKFMLFTKLKRTMPKSDLEEDQEINQGLAEDIQVFMDEPDPKVKFLQKSLETLGEKCRQILELFYYENKNMKEIQALLGYNHPDVVKSHKSRCMKSLKAQFEHKKFEV